MHACMHACKPYIIFPWATHLCARTTRKLVTMATSHMMSTLCAMHTSMAGSATLDCITSVCTSSYHLLDSVLVVVLAPVSLLVLVWYVTMYSTVVDHIPGKVVLAPLQPCGIKAWPQPGRSPVKSRHCHDPATSQFSLLTHVVRLLARLALNLG